jgi:hypothetical protein
MALSILDGNQSATTLSTILSSGQHITAHTVVSLGTQAITDIVNATSAGLTNTQLRASAVTVGGTVTVGNSVTVSSLPAISGTVTANVFGKSGTNDGTLYAIPVNESGNSDVLQRNIPIGFIDSEGFSQIVKTDTALPIQGTVTIGSALPAGTSRIGVVTIGGGTVTIGAGTSQIGSVTASISGTVPVSGTFFQATQPVSLTTVPTHGVTIANTTVTVNGTFYQATQPVSLASLPALVAGTAQIGSVTASISSLPAISGTVTANLSISSTAITSGSFTSLTSATLVPANTARKMATVYNLGAGQLFINAGATATTLGGGFLVALSSGDFYECNYTTTTLSAIFATAGTASWMSF